MASHSEQVPDVLDFIRNRVHKATNSELKTVYHLATLITSTCTSFVDKCVAELPEQGPESFLQIFANAIGIEASLS